MPMLTIKEVAKELRVSQQWLKYWLVENPVDESEVPFYVRMGSRLKFQQNDVERILAYMRKLEGTRLGMSGKSKARLAGLLTRTYGSDYENLIRMREPPKRKQDDPETKVLAELAVTSVFGPRRRKPPQRRVRFPRAKKPEPGG
jgi:DNA-binding transcriptional MerR regulator